MSLSKSKCYEYVSKCKNSAAKSGLHFPDLTCEKVYCSHPRHVKGWFFALSNFSLYNFAQEIVLKLWKVNLKRVNNTRHVFLKLLWTNLKILRKVNKILRGHTSVCPWHLKSLSNPLLQCIFNFNRMRQKML